VYQQEVQHVGRLRYDETEKYKSIKSFTVGTENQSPLWAWGEFTPCAFCDGRHDDGHGRSNKKKIAKLQGVNC
jgi:hypothetical protein